MNDCIEVGAWKTSSACPSGAACVETSAAPTEPPSGHVIRVRDTKVSSKAIGANGQPVGDAAPTLEFSLDAWDELTTSEKEQRAVTTAAAARVLLEQTFSDGTTFVQVPDTLWRATVERSQKPLLLRILDLKNRPRGNVDWVKNNQQDILTFNQNEITAFGKGVSNLDRDGRGEFDLTPELEEEMLLGRAAMRGTAGVATVV